MQPLSNKLCKQTIFRTGAPESCCFTGMGFYLREEPTDTSSPIDFPAVSLEILGRGAELLSVLPMRRRTQGREGWAGRAQECWRGEQKGPGLHCP